MKMKKIDWKILIITSLLCLAPMAIGLVYYDVLPESIAIHFDINNNPNNFWPKDAFVFGMPLLMLIFQLFVCIVTDLNDKRKDANKKISLVAKFTIPIITFILYLVTISYALGNMLDIRVIAMWIVGLMFIIMGNYLPKSKGNTYVRGFVVEDEIIQNKLNKIVGYMLIVNGLLAIISTVLNATFSVMVIIIVIIEAIALSLYSYKIAKRKNKSKE